MCSVEKILCDARLLVNRLRDHDNNADMLISQTQTLHKRIDTMKEYEEDLNQLNEIARHRPRATLVLGIAQENRQIRELQQENRELQVCLHEHQSALELIMNKYREHVVKFILSKKAPAEKIDNSEEVEHKNEKIYEMAAVMQRAIEIDDKEMVGEQQKIKQLEVENRGLRQLLDISSQYDGLHKVDQASQTNETTEL